MNDEQSIKQIGVACTAIGSIGFIISIFMNFNRTLILLSDCSFYIGILFILGIDRTNLLFISPKRFPATVFIIGGVVATILDHGVYGIISHLIGAFLLFGGFLPYLINVLKKLPIVGPVFRIPLPSFFYEMGEDTLPR